VDYAPLRIAGDLVFKLMSKVVQTMTDDKAKAA
jgi:hypothetical protein